MTAEQLRNSILQEAISGRLVPQDPNDEPASVLLQRIREEKVRLVKAKQISKRDFEVLPITEDDVDFDIPVTWEWVRLGDIFKHSTGKALNEANKKGCLHDYITTSNVYWGYFKLDKLRQMYYTEDEKEKCMATKGDLLVLEGGDVGRAAIWDKDYDIFLQNHIHKLRAYTPVCTKFYYYCLYLFHDMGLVGGKGIGIQGLSSGALHQIIFPLPPLAEQKRIVAKLEELLPIVEQYGKAQKELDELNAALPARLRQSILQEAISGKLVPQDENETADGLVKLITDRKNALLKSGELEKRYAKELPIDNSEFEIELPKGWCLCKLGNIARISAGGTPARGVAAYWSNGKIPWLKIADITASEKYVNSASEYITEAGMNNSSAKLMKKGTLLYTIFASIGEVGILNFEATCNQAIANIDLYVPEMTNYIYYYLKNLQAYMYSISKGCAQLNINQDILKNAIVPLPPLAEQARIVAKIEELFTEIDKMI